MADTGARDLLVEIGTEELPASELEDLARQLEVALTTTLADRGIEHGGAGSDRHAVFATPRRLAVRVHGVAAGQKDASIDHRGPPVSAAFDANGRPTRAAAGFARRHGVTVADLVRRVAGKAEYLFYTERRGGAETRAVLPEIVRTALESMRPRKQMSWGVPGVSFPRPVRWAVLLYGDEAIEAELFGVATGHETRGHRFHHPAPIEIVRPADYERRLFEPGWVIAGFDERRESIRRQVTAAAREAGGQAAIGADLLDEVTALVEWPVALAGRFDERFLDVPSEALVAVMTGHQKYFPVYAADGRLLPAFVTVANIASADPEVVRRGNERVIAPRLADAEFFWHQDRRRALEDRLDGLARMVFQQRLGTLRDRAERIASLAAALAPEVGADVGHARAAGRLAKCDLLTEMVGELPELQGIMGAHYARAEDWPEPVAAAIAEHYRPASAEDARPRTAAGRAVALADRLDALVGLFAVGEAPTGDKDPFALRRAALGALLIMVGDGVDVDLDDALARAAAGYPGDLDAEAAVPPVFDFMLERLKAWYTSRTGVTADLFEAVRARRPTRPVDFAARLEALVAFRERREAASLVEANKRIRNILRKADATGGIGEPDPALAREDAERDLLGAVAAAAKTIEPLVAARDYQGALAFLAGLAEPLDRFFTEVMVMTDDAALRANRLALLGHTRGLFLRVADLSHVQGE